MPPLFDKIGDRIRYQVASIEVWRDGVHRACRRRLLAQYVSRASEEEHPAWACSLIEYTYKERVAEFFEWMNSNRWREDWTAEKKDPIQALVYLDYAVKNGRDDLPTAHERMKEHLAAGKGKMPFACQLHGGPTWAPFPFGSPRHPDGFEPESVGVVSPEPIATPTSVRGDGSESDWAQQEAAMALERAPAQADGPGFAFGQDVARMELHIPHAGGSWTRDWRLSETGATLDHVASEAPVSGPSVDSVSTAERRPARLRIDTPSNAASSTRRWVEGDTVFGGEEQSEMDGEHDELEEDSNAGVSGGTDGEMNARGGGTGDADDVEQEQIVESVAGGQGGEVVAEGPNHGHGHEDGSMGLAMDAEHHAVGRVQGREEERDAKRRRMS
ncbi:hypothetical protein CF319_g4992 [Tilletia indica]|nr:hypothetical protein CF319_g4992 [Tilletia indica]KAE8230738.1 hypothetical protein CF326_g4256 [Tilletia indica]